MDRGVNLKLHGVESLNDRVEIPAEPDRAVQQNHEVQIATLPRLVPCSGAVEEDTLKALPERSFQAGPDLLTKLLGQHV